MNFKKAQSEIITVVLIILLVLAAIVIVWQVVNSSINKGASQVTAQSGCIGVTTEVTKINTKVYSIQRTGGGTIAGATLKVFVDGVQVTGLDGSTTGCTWNPVAPTWTADGSTATCTLGSAITAPTSYVSAAILLSDGTACTVGTKGSP